MPAPRPYISLIVPMHNEGPAISAFYARSSAVLRGVESYEIICVNDGSSDDTQAQLESLCARDSRVKILSLSRNFGKDLALTAGLDFCSGLWVVPIDADLQDPPELIPQLLAKAAEGFDVVYAIRKNRAGESWMKRLTAWLFYRVFTRLVGFSVPADVGDFRLMHRRIVKTLSKVREQHRFSRALFAWAGFRQTGIVYERASRHAGNSSLNYRAMWALAKDAITSFSFLPLKLAGYAGLLLLSGAIFGAIYCARGAGFDGAKLTTLAVLFVGGLQLCGMGLLGEYIGRIYNQSKRRPLYLVASARGFNKGLRKNTVGEKLSIIGGQKADNTAVVAVL